MADGPHFAQKSKKNFNKQHSHNVRKRCPPHVRRNNDIYVTSKSNFQGQLSQCEKLFQEGEDAVVLHGIGAAIPRTINLALQLSEKYQGTYELHVETSTVRLVDLKHIDINHSTLRRTGSVAVAKSLFLGFLTKDLVVKDIEEEMFECSSPSLRKMVNSDTL